MLTLAEFDAVLQRYLAGQCLPGEQRLVVQWAQQLGADNDILLHPEQLLEVREAMWERIVALTAPAAGAGAPAPAPAGRVVPLGPACPAWYHRPAPRWVAAATLALGVGAGAWWLTRPAAYAPVVAAAPRWVQLANPDRPMRTLRLADGSRITLYQGSTLRYRPGLATPRREVYLTGQGFFQVAKNPTRPFLVYTEELVTTVLGTSFLVTAYAHQPNKVAVREGRVAVQRRAGASLAATPARPAPAGVLLLPNQQVNYSPAAPQLTRTLVEVPQRVQPEPLRFRKRPVAEVLDALQQAYGVVIVYDPAKLAGCTITIAFGDESLFEQLDALCKALNASYKEANNAQIIFETHVQARQLVLP